MPGPYIHLSSAIAAGLQLSEKGFSPPGSGRIDPAWTGLNMMTGVGDVMAANPNHTALGAIGPDLFYFLPDFRDEHIFGNSVSVSSIMLKILDFYDGLYGALDPIISAYEKFLGPISENLAEEISRMTGGLSEQVSQVMGDLSSICINGVLTLLAELHDWWAFFSLGLNRGYDEQAFMWSDMLHYRRTESFPRALLARAQTLQDDGARAYALGFMTHVATDVAGHAFVNTVSGGPYRSHWQRHHLVENHMDAHWYLRDRNSPAQGPLFADFTRSALHFDIAFAPSTGNPVARPSTSPGGGTLRENWAWRREMDIDSDIPDALAQMIASAIHDVYYDTSVEPPQITPRLLPGDGSPTADDVKKAYANFFAYLKYVTTDGLSHQPPTPPDVFPNLDFPTITDPAGSNAPGASDGGFWNDVLDFFLAVVAVILFIVEVAVYLATLPWAVLADVITYPVRLGVYYALELPLYHVMKALRSTLVMMGYLSPAPDEIAEQLVHIGAGNPDAWASVMTDLSDLFGGASGANVEPPSASSTESEVRFQDQLFPHLHFDTHPMTDDTFEVQAEFRHPWDYPTTPPELATTVSGPHGAGAGAEVLFRPTQTWPSIRDGVETCTDPSQLPGLLEMLGPGKHLGDVVTFSNYIIWLLTRDDPQGENEGIPITEWNLDSDRGYGYHAWDWNRHPLNVSPPPMM